jgi:hypothetical protein
MGGAGARMSDGYRFRGRTPPACAPPSQFHTARYQHAPRRRAQGADTLAMVRGQGSSMDRRRHPKIARPRELPLLCLRRTKSPINTDEPVTRDAYEKPR